MLIWGSVAAFLLGGVVDDRGLLLVEYCWWSIVGGLLLVGYCWWSIAGGVLLVGHCWWGV